MSADASRRLHLWSGLIVLGVFLAGALAGAGVFAWLRPLPAPPRFPGGFHALLRELDLTPEQQRQARAIAEKRHAAMEEVLKQTFPQVRAAQEEMDRELRAILTDAQAKKFDEIRARHPPPPHGPGRFRPPDFGAPDFGPSPGRPPPPPKTMN